MSIKQKIGWILLIIGVLPLSIVIALYSNIFFRVSVDNAKNHLIDLAVMSATQLNTMLVNAVRDTRALASSHLDESADSQILTKELTKFTFSYPYFKEVLWVTPNGTVAAASIRSYLGQTIDRIYPEIMVNFLHIMREPAVNKLGVIEVRSSDSGMLSLKLLNRVDTAQGEPAGVLITSLFNDPIQMALRDIQMRTPGGYSVGLLNQHGDILMTSDDSNFHDHQWTNSLMGILHENPDKENAFVIDDVHGKDVVAVAPLPGIPGQEFGTWWVVAVASLDVVTQQASQTLLRTIVAGLTLAGCVFLAGWWIAWRIVKRINLLITGTQAISLGDLTHRIIMDEDDELGALARAFNDMSSKINEMDKAKEVTADKLAQIAVSMADHAMELENNLELIKLQNHVINLRNKLGDMLQSCQEIDGVGVLVSIYLPLLFPTSIGALYLSNDQNAVMTKVADWGVTDSNLVQHSFDRDHCWGLRQGKLHKVDERKMNPLCEHISPTVPAFSLCIPMIARSQSMGLLHLEYVRRVTPHLLDHDEMHRELAVSVATLLAMTVSNVRLSAILLEESIHDKLTGLYNRRHLETVLSREIARATREKHSLALLLLDVDHFKRFNDTYGHEAGDAVLRSFGQVLRDNCRQGDTACRFGGEEFVILLADTDEVCAREWGERLRSRLCNMKVKTGNTELPPVTASMGLALYPVHGKDESTLLKAADVALYDAKSNGRDRLMCSVVNYPAPEGIEFLSYSI